MKVLMKDMRSLNLWREKEDEKIAPSIKMNARLIFICFGITTLAGCTCNSEILCPESFGVGESCEMEGQECIYPQSLCGTPCRCVNQPGGFVWECATQYCKCTCDCGRYAISSCELLQCTQEEDPCVAQALPLCEMVCTKDAGPDGAKDGGRDQTPDGVRDQTVREMGPDAGRDSAVDTKMPRDVAVDKTADAPKDVTADLPRDATQDSL